ncbi:tRNA (cytidine(56)-2'-O)-methyltransferase [Candidatus Woesearchaeota archaeon]|nr:tRNA (cytidine(56)-2'-O)-methyltransferase [Candidatus Woesearchaeota archaeon]
MITVMRYGHRPMRDKRTTTHVGLVARAFGADRILLAGTGGVPKSILDVVDRWGGDFRVETVREWRRFLRDFQGTRIHLTMYGLPLGETIDEIRERSLKGDLLIFVGAEKVPPEVYEWCDYNVAVGSQPHSEIAALAVFLDHLHRGAELECEFPGAELRVVPSERGKEVKEL